MKGNQRNEAFRLYLAGLVPIPILPDGQKAPAVPYAAYRDGKSLPNAAKVGDWFRAGERSMAVLGGHCSGGLEQLDFDNHKTTGQEFQQWCEAVPQDLLKSLVIYKTPGNGYKVCWRCWGCLEAPGEVLAYRNPGEPSIELLCKKPLMCPGGSPKGHPTGKPYQYIRGHLAETPTINQHERDLLIAEARKLSLFEPPPKCATHHQGEYEEASEWTAQGDFNRRASWEDILEPKGWEKVGEEDEASHWLRPGKYGRGVSATTNYRGSDLFYCFSSSTEFKSNKGYEKWAAWAILYCEGDFSKAVKELAHLGYGRANQDIQLVYDKIERLYNA